MTRDEQGKKNSGGTLYKASQTVQSHHDTRRTGQEELVRFNNTSKLYCWNEPIVKVIYAKKMQHYMVEYIFFRKVFMLIQVIHQGW